MYSEGRIIWSKTFNCYSEFDSSSEAIMETIGGRKIFCRGGGGQPFAQKILTSCPNFYERTVEKKRGPYYATT